MACPMGFSAKDGPNPHLSMDASVAVPTVSVPQSDGRQAPKLPPRTHLAQKKPVPWHETKVRQGPIPPWVSFISSWYNYFWGVGRALLLAAIILAIVPFLHATTFITLSIPRRVNLPTIARRLVGGTGFQLMRCVQALYTGVIVCLCESIGGARIMFSGTMKKNFWDATIDASTTPTNRGNGASSSPSATPSVTPSKPTSSSSSGTAITLFLSNQTAYTSFMDVLVFFSIVYRRKQLSNLYFSAMEKDEWDIMSLLLFYVFLEPLTISNMEEMDMVVAYSANRGVPINLVWFPESTSIDDTLAITPVSSSVGTNEELLHVRQPHLSKLFVNTLHNALVSPVASGISSVSIIDCTLAYSGSVRAEVEQQHAEERSWNGLEPEEEEEFESEFEAKAQQSDTAATDTTDEDDDSMMGYSDATINQSYGNLLTRRRQRKFEPSIPVFCTAAPLRKMDEREFARIEGSSSQDNSSSYSYSKPSPSPKSRAALLRTRVVPSFFCFLSGNAPTQIHVLMNQSDELEIKQRIVKIDSTEAKKDVKTSSHSTPSLESRTEFAASLDTWLHQRFLHQEQQLTLFAIHSVYHQLPYSLSASSIPISQALESYTAPVSSIKLSMYVIADWIVIVFTTLLIRTGRTYF